jgi:hypothetical protein
MPLTFHEYSFIRQSLPQEALLSPAPDTAVLRVKPLRE